MLLKANTEERVKAVARGARVEVHQARHHAQSLDTGAPYPSGKEFRVEVGLKNGIEQDAAKKINKLIRDEAPKSVKSQIQGDELRVSSKSRDDLQATMALLKNADLDVAVQFVNFR
ncbi:DUF520 family protein [Leifsonia sp. L25]|uniref:DUF520 family protein n=1 Tax=Leifsonia sp. L25 TaxID=3423957 RepID=UPI003D6917D7